MLKIKNKHYKILEIKEEGIWFEDEDYAECFIPFSETDGLPFHPVCLTKN